ncbi:MAG: S8 family serine peptidase [Oscillospiraceae bacterium]
MLASFVVPVRAAGLSWNAVDTAVSADLADRLVQGEAQETVHRDTDLVRVSIVLEEKPTVQAGYSTMDIARNDGAMAYRESLQARQQAVAQSISAQALGGQALDVVWNLTLVGNIISANVPYGKLEAISQVEGVRSVSLERQYAPAEASRGDEGAQPQMYTSAGMIGSDAAWLEGYTGAGTRIAVIDTGTDTDHQSFQAEAFHHALEENAKEAGMSYADYAAKLDLLDEEEIDSLLEKLHIHEKSPQLTGKDLYLNEKLALGYNYVDSSLEITHDHDAQGEHGSHVAGISTANRFLKQGDGFVSAAEAVNVCGVAPDAQLLTMKVFGQKGGAYESDYMVAIEDAIMLGADAVNLSLGSAAPGEAANETYAKLLDSLQDTDTVVVISAGNSGSWADGTTTNGFCTTTA